MILKVIGKDLLSLLYSENLLATSSSKESLMVHTDWEAGVDPYLLHSPLLTSILQYIARLTTSAMAREVVDLIAQSTEKNVLHNFKKKLITMHLAPAWLFSPFISSLLCNHESPLTLFFHTKSYIFRPSVRPPLVIQYLLFMGSSTVPVVQICFWHHVYYKFQ